MTMLKVGHATVSLPYSKRHELGSVVSLTHEALGALHISTEWHCIKYFRTETPRVQFHMSHNLKTMMVSPGVDMVHDCGMGRFRLPSKSPSYANVS